MQVARWVAASLVVASLGWAVGHFSRTAPTNEPQFAERATAPVPIPARLAKLDFAAILSQANDAVAKRRDKTLAEPGEWVNFEALASALLARARLTGSFDDYIAARKAADSGMAIAPKGTGPHLVRAVIALATHRLNDAIVDLDAISHYAIPDMQTTAESTAMRGDVALYHGLYSQADRLYASAEEGGAWTGLTYRRAALASQTGKIELAAKLFTEADTQTLLPTPAFRSDMMLRQGELDLAQGNWPAASATFEQANRIFPGSWRIQMRLAQMLALGGKVAPAIKAFERIAVATNAPEPMDIAAGLYRAKGDATLSKLWSDRAGAIWAKRLAQLPEAAWGHALEHELAFGDPARALAFAYADARQRPFGVALIGLAKALTANRNPAAAAALLEKVNASGWQSVEQHLALADAYTLLGNSDGVEAERAAAVAINPKAFARNPAFVWLDH